MAYQFTQTGAQIQSILDQVGTNTGDIAQNTSDITALSNKFTSGTWTPSIPRANLSAATGKWRKIGDVVFLYGSITFNSSQTNQGELYIDGTSLPADAKGGSITGNGAGSINFQFANASNNNVWLAIVGSGRFVATASGIPGSTIVFGLMAIPNT